MDSSDAHPLVTFVATADSVSLEQAGALQREPNHELMGSMMEADPSPMAKETKDEGLRQAEASSFWATEVRADWQLLESL